MREPGQVGNAVGPKTTEPRGGRAQCGHEAVRNEEVRNEEVRNEEVRNDEDVAAPSGLWPLWEEAEERGDRDVAALMWEAMYGRGPGR